MIGLVIAAHGDLAFSYGSVLAHILGPLQNVRAISINPDDDLSQKTKEIQSAVDAVRGEQGVIVATDLFGGTPTNLSMALTQDPKVDVISGINLPALIKIMELRESVDLKTLARAAKQAGVDQIHLASSLLETQVQPALKSSERKAS